MASLAYAGRAARDRADDTRAHVGTGEAPRGGSRRAVRLAGSSSTPFRCRRARGSWRRPSRGAGAMRRRVSPVVHYSREEPSMSVDVGPRYRTKRVPLRGPDGKVTGYLRVPDK